MLEEKTQELMVNMQAVLPLIVTNALSALGAIVILLIGLPPLPPECNRARCYGNILPW